jgi:hypothetical protein
MIWPELLYRFGLNNGFRSLVYNIKFQLTCSNFITRDKIYRIIRFKLIILFELFVRIYMLIEQ